MDVDTTPKSNQTLWVVSVIAFLATLIFIGWIFMYFILYNTTATHQITITNNTMEPLNILVGTEIIQDNIVSLASIAPQLLQPGASTMYYATPSVNVTIQAYSSDQILPDTYPYPFTKTTIRFSGITYNGRTYIKNNEAILYIDRNDNFLDNDIYGVSMKDGYNYIMNVSVNGDKKSDDMFSCAGPIWNGPIDDCPDNLIYGDGATACMNPCYATAEDGYCCVPKTVCGEPGGCQSSWLDIYNIFFAACNSCMITNCDVPRYYCRSGNNLTTYNISFEQ